MTRIVTPGTVIEDQILEAGRNNFLAGICRGAGGFGLALIDLSTGLFCGEEPGSAEALRDSLTAFAPAECVVPQGQREDPELKEILRIVPGMHVTGCDDWTFAYDAARDALIRHFRVHSLEGFGCEGLAAARWGGASCGTGCSTRWRGAPRSKRGWTRWMRCAVTGCCCATCARR